MNFLSGLVSFLKDVGKWALHHFIKIVAWGEGLVTHLASHFGFLWHAMKGAFTHLNKLWSHLHGLKTSHLWGEMQHWYKRYQGWNTWYRKRLLEPMQFLHNIQHQVYDGIFGPVVRSIDTFRTLSHSLFFWDKKLAGKLDSFFWQLENKALAPYTVLVKQLNHYSSYLTAILTYTGRFDATTFMRTLSHIDQDWRAVKWGLPLEKKRYVAASVTDAYAGAFQAHKEYVETGSGPIKDLLDEYGKTSLAVRAALDLL